MDRPDADHGDQPPIDPEPVATTDQPTAADHAAAPLPVTIDEAAIALGITANAVRQRLKRGTLPGEKTAGGWVVWLPTDQATTGDQPTGQPPTTGRPASDRPRPTSGTGVDLAPLAELIERQGDEIRRLTEASVMWQVRAIQAEERLKQLTAGDETVQDASTASPEGPGEAEQPRPGQEATPPAGWRRWLWWVHRPRDE